MGVEYCHYLIPTQQGIDPTAKKLERLLAALRTESWITYPEAAGFSAMTFGMYKPYAFAKESGAYLETSEGYESVPVSPTEGWLNERLRQDNRLVWPVECWAESGLRYPMRTKPECPPEEIYYEFQIHLAADYVYRTSEVIDPFDSTNCDCGAELKYWPDEDDNIYYSARIRKTCPKCKKRFEPQTRQCVVRDGYTGRESTIAGGATSAFAIAVDLGKCHSQDSVEWSLESRLVRLCEESLGSSLRQVGDFR